MTPIKTTSEFERDGVVGAVRLDFPLADARSAYVGDGIKRAPAEAFEAATDDAFEPSPLRVRLARASGAFTVSP